MTDFSDISNPGVDDLSGHDPEEIMSKTVPELRRDAWNQYRNLSWSELKEQVEVLNHERLRQFDMDDESHPGAVAKRPDFPAKQKLLTTRVEAISALLNYKRDVGPNRKVPEYEEVFGEVGFPVSDEGQDSPEDYLDAITIVLERHSEGDFGSNRSIYNKVAELGNLEQGTCRRAMYRWGKSQSVDEPQNEQEWREYLL